MKWSVSMDYLPACDSLFSSSRQKVRPNPLDSSGGNTVGLRFLARHLVTLNFPKRMMYLKRTSVGPLIDESRSTNAAPSIGRDEELKAATPELSGANP